MSETILARNIRALRTHLGLNQDDFARRVNSKQANVSRWEKQGSVPEPGPLAKMAELAGDSLTDFLEIEWSAPADRGVAVRPRVGSDDDVVEITALDLSLSMGPGTLIEDFVESEPVKMGLNLIQSITRTPSDRLRFVKGIGDSMEPTLRTGDRVMVDINERARTRLDGIYWISVFDAHGIKRLKGAKGGRVRVISDNPGVPDEEHDVDDVRIEGRVIWFAREL